LVLSAISPSYSPNSRVDHSSIIQIGCPSEAVSLFRFTVSFYISQLFQFGHFHYLLFCTQHQPQASLLASSGTHCPHRTNLPCQRYHTAMSHSTTPAEIQLNKQELHEFVDKSSKWRMKTKGDVKEYATIFWYCCDPLITSHYMSLGECKELFWQGFHPDTHAQFPPDAKQQIWDILQRTPTNDLVVSTPAAPADPSPSPPPVSDLIACMPPLFDAHFSSTSLPSLPSLGRPKGPWPALATTTPLTSAAPVLRRPISVLPPSPICKVPSPPFTQSQPISVSPPSPVRKIMPPPSVQSHSSKVSLLPLPPTPQVREVSPPSPVQSMSPILYTKLQQE